MTVYNLINKIKHIPKTRIQIEVAVGEVNEFGEHSRESSRINDRLNSVQLQIG